MEPQNSESNKKIDRLNLIKSRHDLLKKIKDEKTLDPVADKIQRESEG